MNIREAILKAADHIEHNPGRFQFNSVFVPNDCGSPGCAIGWIGRFAGAEQGSMIEILHRHDKPSAVELLGLRSQEDFYDRMRELALVAPAPWQYDAAQCAKALRIYADTYHPAQSTPDWHAIAYSTDLIHEELANAVEIG